MDTINATRVTELLRACLPTSEEAAGRAPDATPAGADLVRGVVRTYAINRERAAAHAPEVRRMLALLPDAFRARALGGGDGLSFLNMCVDRHGQQWADLHRTMEELLVLGLAVGAAEYCLGREFWSALPGGMPYVRVTNID
jgi:hypothetical protein